MPYCANCGNKLDINGHYCPNCGQQTQKTADSASRHINVTPPVISIPAGIPFISDTRSRTGAENFVNALAYIPPLFWLPMLVYPNNARARDSAGQGLWLFIFTVLSAVMSCVVWFAFMHFAGIDAFVPVQVGQHTRVIIPNYTADYMIMIIPGAIIALNWTVIGICSAIGFIRSLQNTFWQVPLFGKLKFFKNAD